MKNDDLGNRMKKYEGISRIHLLRKIPVIIRIDGKAFHTFTKGFRKPFDDVLMETMYQTTKYLCENIQGCKLAYTQSDEISLLLTDYEKINTDSWFDYNIQKVSSISASMATLAFNKFFSENVSQFFTNNTWVDDLYKKYNAKNNMALFDSRAFNIPKEDVCNYFIWRQEDATRNSIQMVAQANFPHKQLQSLSCNQLQEKLFQEKEINWNNLPVIQKRGTCVKKMSIEKIVDTPKGQISVNRRIWTIDKDIPIFKQNRNYINEHL